MCEQSTDQQQSPRLLSALNEPEDRFAGGIIVGARKLIFSAAAELDLFNEELWKKSLELQQSEVSDGEVLEVQAEVSEADDRRLIDVVMDSINPAESSALLEVRTAVENYLTSAKKMVFRLKTIVDKTTHISKKHSKTYGIIRDYYASLKELDAIWLPTDPQEWYKPEQFVMEELVIPNITERKVAPVLSDKADRKQRGSRSSESSETTHTSGNLKANSEGRNTTARTEPDPDELILVQLCLHKVCPYVAYNTTSEEFKNHYREHHPKGRIPADIYHVVRMKRSEYKRQRNQWEKFYARK